MLLVSLLLRKSRPTSWRYVISTQRSLVKSAACHLRPRGSGSPVQVVVVESIRSPGISKVFMSVNKSGGQNTSSCKCKNFRKMFFMNFGDWHFWSHDQRPRSFEHTATCFVAWPALLLLICMRICTYHSTGVRHNMWGNYLLVEGRHCECFSSLVLSNY